MKSCEVPAPLLSAKGDILTQLVFSRKCGRSLRRPRPKDSSGQLKDSLNSRLEDLGSVWVLSADCVSGDAPANYFQSDCTCFTSLL